MAFVYSCCFWFSLRLGGILIGLFSLAQALVVLITCIVAQARGDEFQTTLSSWVNDFHMPYFKVYLESIRDDPDKFLSIAITLTCMYMLLCCLYIYGAYTLNNSLMVGYILVEFLRLLTLSLAVSTCLLILKQNTMDIGLLICASVVSGFTLLGMFYLWVCATNLPILINEMEREKQAATISRLRQLLENNPTQRTNINPDDLALTLGSDYGLHAYRNKDIFVMPNSSNDLFNGHKINIPTNKLSSRFAPPPINSFRPAKYSTMLR